MRGAGCLPGRWLADRAPEERQDDKGQGQEQEPAKVAGVTSDGSRGAALAAEDEGRAVHGVTSGKAALSISARM